MCAWAHKWLIGIQLPPRIVCPSLLFIALSLLFFSFTFYFFLMLTLVDTRTIDSEISIAAGLSVDTPTRFFHVIRMGTDPATFSRYHTPSSYIYNVWMNIYIYITEEWESFKRTTNLQHVLFLRNAWGCVSQLLRFRIVFFFSSSLLFTLFIFIIFRFFFSLYLHLIYLIDWSNSLWRVDIYPLLHYNIYRSLSRHSHSLCDN